MSRKFYTAVLFALFSTVGAFSQVGSGTLQGKITDAKTGEALPFVNIVVLLNGNQVAGRNTDFDGAYSIKPIEAGTYDVSISSVGFNSKRINGVKVNANKITFLDEKLDSGIQLDEAVVVEYVVPLIDKDGGSSGGTVTREEIGSMPARDVGSIATTVAGVSSAGTDGLSIRGARSASTWYYIDGIKVRGSQNLPKSAIEEVSVMTGGVPANYGDATGGIITITTRGASSTYFGGVELITSGFRFGETARGLDRYGYNLVEGSLSGPILWIKDAEGNKDRPRLGFFLSGNFTSQVDPRPAFGGVYRMKEESRQLIIDNPLRQNIAADGTVNGALYNADFLTPNDFEKVPTRLNVGSNQASLAAKIDVTTTNTINLTFGGSGSFRTNNSFSYANMLMNHENNQLATDYDWRAYGKFSQRFISEAEEGKASTLKNVFYTLMVDYSRAFSKRENAKHKDDFFKYGHVGRFDIGRENTYAYQFNPDLPYFNSFVQTGNQDTLVSFTASEFNPTLSAVNTQFFGLFDDEEAYSDLLTVQNGGAILNGFSPRATYNLWQYVGNPVNQYNITNQAQFRITGTGSADIGNHAVQVGFEYEQRNDASYGLSPVDLWRLGRLYLNSHIEEFDTDGVPISITNNGSFNYVTFDRLVGENQFYFDQQVREELGAGATDYLNIDSMDPSMFILDFFSADELFNQGNNVVDYFGYDHTGKRQKGKSTLEDFFNDRDENGNLTRPIGAYEPIYISGFMMDKFAFDDIIFNVGIRVDRFDANQPVPKDPFVIGRAYTAGEVSTIGGQSVTHPSNIGDDYVVYVDDVDNPGAILGYRQGEVWYNASGAEIDDPFQINSINGNPAPYMIGGGSAPLTSEAFQAYEPQINIMPRIAFSFPISDEAVFYAHYNVLTQRPTSSNRFNPIDYLYLAARNVLIDNPNLRPEKTIDYALGFQQVLSKSSSLKLEAFYREMRDLIQVRNFTGAYPRTYRAFGNLDFGTVKGFTTTFDLRKTGNVRLKASYTLQFAEGTGSTTATALALINAGLPNLRTVTPLNYDQRHRIVLTTDYRYGEGTDYNGPVWFGKQVFANTGVNVISVLGSGTPYTASNIATPVTGEVSPSTQGSINGSRLPWQFTVDMTIDKNMQMVLGSKDGKEKMVNVNVYLWISNLLNTMNVNSVYRFSGVPDDDGYLAAAQYQPLINSQNSPDAFRNYYSMYVDNPFNYGPPRTIRLGVKFDF